jgi:predicted ribosome-associated RNA-binding protein Tma20
MVRALPIFEGVEKRIFDGADLFLPGIFRSSNFESEATSLGVSWVEFLFGPPFKRGDLVVLIVAGQWAPFAIGQFAMSSTEVAASGLKGVGVEIIHHREDALWKTGTKVC